MAVDISGNLIVTSIAPGGVEQEHDFNASTARATLWTSGTATFAVASTGTNINLPGVPDIFYFDNPDIAGKTVYINSAASTVFVVEQLGQRT